MLQHAGLDPVEATVLGGLFSSSTSFLRKTRGWSDDDDHAAADRLRDRGWLDADGGFTELGRTERQRIEDDTDRIAGGRLGTRVGAERTARLHELVKPLRRAVVDTGLLPIPRA